MRPRRWRPEALVRDPIRRKAPLYPKARAQQPEVDRRKRLSQEPLGLLGAHWTGRSARPPLQPISGRLGSRAQRTRLCTWPGGARWPCATPPHPPTATGACAAPSVRRLNGEEDRGLTWVPLSLNPRKGLCSQNQLASSSPTPGSLPQGPAQLSPGETEESQQGHTGALATCMDQEVTAGHPFRQRPPPPPPARSRPYSCAVCGKRFSLKHQMETHHRVHTGEKPFSCGLCPQRSRDFSAMTKHLRTHGAAPYRCPLCGAGCPSLASMQAHMRSHSPSQLPPGWTIRSTFLYSSSSSSSSSRPPRASTSPCGPSSTARQAV
ncbi:zinc finger and BTB domain-containing protein 32 isoform X3 [Oryctolagus cuniculus]|uniref:zinc finger and BTB domain-containing protein 32 isoform X3 n=1 Tax=Oryctolagus cuniculus TaxID=9986 RepID=UPI002230420E|nr:zinc finger and BTB domain-containing protein 32 isoform X3 [Oryctolagus cuniculus]